MVARPADDSGHRCAGRSGDAASARARACHYRRKANDMKLTIYCGSLGDQRLGERRHAKTGRTPPANHAPPPPHATWSARRAGVLRPRGDRVRSPGHTASQPIPPAARSRPGEDHAAQVASSRRRAGSSRQRPARTRWLARGLAREDELPKPNGVLAQHERDLSGESGVESRGVAGTPVTGQRRSGPSAARCVRQRHVWGTA